MTGTAPTPAVLRTRGRRLVSAAAAVSASAPAAADARRTRLFIHSGFIGCLLLQRFGVYLQNAELYVCLPLFLVGCGWAVATGIGGVRPRSLLFFLLACSSFMLSTVLAAAFPVASVGMSPLSLLGVVATYVVLLFGPTRRFRSEYVFPIFLFYARLCCALGIAQYALQFVHVKLFTMGDYLPPLRPILLESHYNTSAIIKYGSTVLRANGIFILEPGGLSQLIAVAALVDTFLQRSFRYLPLYAVGYIVTYSGTGLILFAVTLAFVPLFSPRDTKLLLLLGLAGAVAAAALGVVFSSQVATMVTRLNEFQTPGSSGYSRYVAQGEAWRFFSQNARLVFGYGPGAFERAPISQEGTGSAAIKLFADYGVAGLALFAVFLVTAVYNRRYIIATVMMLALFQLGGGNLLQSPVIIWMALVCIWSDAPATAQVPEPEPEPAIPGARSPRPA